MRILQLTPELPAPSGGSGGSTRQFHLLRRLAELGHDVTVVAPAPGAPEPPAEVLAEAGVRTELVPRPSFRATEALRALVCDPELAPAVITRPVLGWQVAVFWASLRPSALRLAKERPPDLVVVEHDGASGWAADLPRELPAVLTCHNVSWRYYQQRSAAATGLAARLLAVEARRFRTYDLRHFHRYATLITVSEPDREAILREGPFPVEVVPNGVATDEFAPAAETDGDPTLVFTGTMSHPPNAEGVLWFHREIWPHVVAEYPDVRLVVVGRNPPRSIQALTADFRVEVTGAVADVAPYFARATAVVVPLLSGGGTRLKILEALASGRAVVSTSTGAEGLELEPGRDLLVEDEPETFGREVLRLLDNSALRQKLAASGRKAVEDRYDWRRLGDRLAQVFEAAIEDARA